MYDLSFVIRVQTILYYKDISIYIYTHTHTHTHHTYHFFLIYLSVSVYLVCIPALPVLDSASVNIVFVYLFQLEFSPGICPGVGLLYHRLLTINLAF